MASQLTQKINYHQGSTVSWASLQEFQQVLKKKIPERFPLGSDKRAGRITVNYFINFFKSHWIKSIIPTTDSFTDQSYLKCQKGYTTRERLVNITPTDRPIKRLKYNYKILLTHLSITATGIKYSWLLLFAGSVFVYSSTFQNLFLTSK